MKVIHLLFLFEALFVQQITGHGYLYSPRSRNFRAHASQDGSWSGGDENTPPAENCPHCLNRGGTSGRCGRVASRNYDNPKNIYGRDLPWQNQAVYPTGGAEITIEAILTAHHKGHFNMKACPVSPGEIPSQACFDSHPLEYVSDELYNAPKDPLFAERAYIAPPNVAQQLSTGVSGYHYKFKYKLPSNLSGTVLLQWHYLTANSCLPGDGYDSYPFPGSDWHSGLAVCPHLPPDGDGVPEQFWNCAEVCIGDNCDGEPITSAPTKQSSPTTDSPTKAPISTPKSPTSAPSPSPPTTLSPTRPPSEASDKMVVAYYASWQYYDRGSIAKPTNMDFSKVDRINFAFFQPDVNGNLFGTDSWGDPLVLFGPLDWTGTQHCSWDGPNQKACNNHRYEEGLIHLVHQAGGEIYPSIGGWTLSDNFPAVAASATARTNFANQCVEIIKDYGFDGIDIDWEYPGYAVHSGTPNDKYNYNLLLNELRAKLDALGQETGKYYGITAALPCGPSHIANLDIPHLSNVLDELLLMAYDLHGAWDPVTGVNAPLYYQGFGDMNFSVDSCVQNWKNGGAPSNKISVGLGFYGRSFAYATGLNQPHQGADTNNWFADDGLPQYFNIVDRSDDMTIVRHDISKTPFAFFNNGSGFVSFDDERSICEKTEYVIDNDLLGFLIWEISGDLMPDLSTPLLDSINSKLADPSMNCAGGPPRSPSPTSAPTSSPTASPSASPSKAPTKSPVTSTESPVTNAPIASPVTNAPVATPTTNSPVASPTKEPTKQPTFTLTSAPTKQPTAAPTPAPVPQTACPSGFSGMRATSTCESFVYCTNGAVTSNPIPCAAGTLFDNSISNCNWDYLVNCISSPPPPSMCTYGKLVAVEQCAGYQHCGVNGQLSGTTIPCPGGTLFDEALQVCNWTSQVNCGGRRLRGGSKNAN